MVVARQFTYDTLSRLITSSNPETGTICYGIPTVSGAAGGNPAVQPYPLPIPAPGPYTPPASPCPGGYDAHGNLIAKTDARGKTVHYSYDSLNRLTGKTYSPIPTDAPATPPSTYTYDSSSVPNSTGRLVSETTTGATGNVITQRSIVSYDAMGRIWEEKQCPFAPICGAAPYDLQYNYDLAGNLVYSNNGSTNMGIGLTYSYDGVNRLQTVTSTWDDATHPATLFGPPICSPCQVQIGGGPSQYGPAGLLQASLGIPSSAATIAQPSYTQQRDYDNRMRIADETDNGSGIATPGSATILFTGGDGSTIAGGRHVCPIIETGCQTIPDAGTITITVTGPTGDITGSQDYDGEDDATLTSELAATMNSVASSILQAIAVGPSLTLTANATGQASDYPMVINVTGSDDYQYQATGNGAKFTGGADASGPGPVYAYSLTYQPNSNVATVDDTVTGSWTYGYDSLNRLTSAQAGASVVSGAAPYQLAQLGWGYDAYGNYGGQTLTGSTSAAVNQGSYSYTAQNQIVGMGYDLAGNLTGLGYAFDAESRVQTVGGLAAYIYDADGKRVAKQSLSLPNAFANNPSDIGTLTPNKMYLYGPGGEQLTELDGSGNWIRTNVYGGGTQLATYDAGGLHFNFTDWIGTRRVQGSGVGAVEETCLSLPFGDSLQCFSANGGGVSIGQTPDANDHHFTGKERDQESGLDYFGARYFSSNMGRWISPDWSAKEEPVPYATLDDPQSLNLYSYVRNNPLRRIDTDGHVDVAAMCKDAKGTCNVQVNQTVNLTSNGKTYSTINIQTNFSVTKDDKGNASVSATSTASNVSGQKLSAGQLSMIGSTNAAIQQAGATMGFGAHTTELLTAVAGKETLWGTAKPGESSPAKDPWINPLQVSQGRASSDDFPGNVQNGLDILHDAGKSSGFSPGPTYQKFCCGSHNNPGAVGDLKRWYSGVVETSSH